jgi:hypothetical protein
MKNLKPVSLEQTKVTSNAAEQLREEMPKCRVKRL